MFFKKNIPYALPVFCSEGKDAYPRLAERLRYAFFMIPIMYIICRPGFTLVALPLSEMAKQDAPSGQLGAKVGKNVDLS